MTGNAFTRTTRLALLLVPVLAVLLALPRTSYAQRFTAELSRTVLDESGGVIPGADVTLKNEASGAVRRSVTNAGGGGAGTDYGQGVAFDWCQDFVVPSVHRVRSPYVNNSSGPVGV